MTRPPGDVAVDGVDEILAAMVSRTFSWGTFVPGPESVRLALAGPESVRLALAGPESVRLALAGPAEERAPRDWTMDDSPAPGRSPGRRGTSTRRS